MSGEKSYFTSDIEKENSDLALEKVFTKVPENCVLFSEHFLNFIWHEHIGAELKTVLEHRIQQNNDFSYKTGFSYETGFTYETGNAKPVSNSANGTRL